MIAHVFISGFVQGVGFRRFVKHHAVKIGLKGWVKNLPDNRVEALFAGSKEQIEKIIAICQKGAFLSEVKGIDVIWEENPEEAIYKTFEVIF
jgi:acylphosphatase